MNSSGESNPDHLRPRRGNSGYSSASSRERSAVGSRRRVSHSLLVHDLEDVEEKSYSKVSTRTAVSTMSPSGRDKEIRGSRASNRANSVHSNQSTGSRTDLQCAWYGCDNCRIGRCYCIEHQRSVVLAIDENGNHMNDFDPDLDHSGRLLAVMEMFLASLCQMDSVNLELVDLVKCILSNKIDEVFDYFPRPKVDWISEVQIIPSSSLGTDDSVKKTLSGAQADLSTSVFSRGALLSLHRNTSEPPVTGLALMLPKKQEEPPYLYKKVSKAVGGKSACLNSSTSMGELFVCTQKHGGGCPLSEIAVFSPKRKEILPPFYHMVSRTSSGRASSLVFQSDGSPAFLCMKYDLSFIMMTFLQLLNSDTCTEDSLSSAAMGILVCGMFSGDENIVLESVKALRLIQVQDMASSSKGILDCLLRFVSHALSMFVSVHGSDVISKTMTLIRDISIVRYADLSMGGLLRTMRVAFALRRQDRKEHLLESVCDYVCSMLKDVSYKKQRKRRARRSTRSSEGCDDGPDKIAGECLQDIVDHVGFTLSHRSAVLRFHLHKVADDFFISDTISLVKSLVSDPIERTVSCIILFCCKMIVHQSTLTVTMALSESVKRQTHALKMFQKTIHMCSGFLKGSEAGAFIMRRCVFPCVLQCCPTVVPVVFQLCLKLVSYLWRYYRNIAKIELGEMINTLLLGMVQLKSCSPEQKIDLLEGICLLFQRPESIVDLYFNYDLLYPSCTVFENLVKVSAGVAGGNQMIPLNQQDFALQCAGLATVVNIIELLSKSLVRKSGFVPNQFKRLRKVDQIIEDDEAMDANREHSESKSKNDDITVLSSSFLPESELLSPSRRKNRRQDTWIIKYEENEKIKKMMSNVSSQKNVKSAVRALYEQKRKKFNSDEIALFLKNNKTLNQREIGEFMGSDYDSLFSSEQFISIRSAYLRLIDFTSLTFDQSLRLFLCNSGFRLPGEAQKIDRLLEAFAEAYCRDNPGVFNSPDVAFLISFALIMLNTDLHDPRLQGKRSRPPMSLDDFIRGLRDTDGGNSLSRELLSDLYQSIVDESIEWKEDLDNSADLKSPSRGHNLENMERNFRSECSVLIRQVMAVVRRDDVLQKQFYHCSTPDIIEGMFQVGYPMFLNAISALISSSRAVDVIAVCLDGIKYGCCAAIILEEEDKTMEFAKLLARLSYQESFTGTEEQLQKDLLAGEHLDQEWLEDLRDIASKDVKSACRKVNSVASRVRRKVLFDRDQKVLVDIQNELSGDISIVDKERRFVREGELLKVGRNNHRKVYRFILFNNLLVYCSLSSTMKKWKVHKTLHLSLCRIVDLKDRPGDGLMHCFRIANPQKSFTLVCNGETEKAGWLGDIKKSIEGTLATQRKWIEDEEAGFFEPSVSKASATFTGKSSVGASSKKMSVFLGRSDVKSAICKLCIREFGTFQRRKYECPYCDQCVCNECSSKKAELVDFDGVPAGHSTKVCDACYGILTGKLKLDVPVLTKEI